MEILNPKVGTVPKKIREFFGTNPPLFSKWKIVFLLIAAVVYKNYFKTVRAEIF